MNTDDLKVVSKFIEYLGPEVLNYCDSSGNTLFHYAVGCLDEDSIYKVIVFEFAVNIFHSYFLFEDIVVYLHKIGTTSNFLVNGKWGVVDDEKQM